MTGDDLAAARLLGESAALRTLLEATERLTSHAELLAFHEGFETGAREASVHLSDLTRAAAN